MCLRIIKVIWILVAEYYFCVTMKTIKSCKYTFHVFFLLFYSFTLNSKIEWKCLGTRVLSNSKLFGRSSPWFEFLVPPRKILYVSCKKGYKIRANVLSKEGILFTSRLAYAPHLDLTCVTGVLMWKAPYPGSFCFSRQTHWQISQSSLFWATLSTICHGKIFRNIIEDYFIKSHR